MKTPYEIKKGLKIGACDCDNVRCCEDECPYERECSPDNDNKNADVPQALLRDSLAYIQQLEAERDAMKALFVDHNDLCAICKHQDYDDVVCSKVDYCCELCSPNCACHGCVEASHYEWHGVQKEE